MITIITYGTFDLFHIGHLRILESLRALGDRLVVGVSTDEFNLVKGKSAFIPYSQRAEIVAALKCVDIVIPEVSWQQKPYDITKYAVHTFGIGDDWKGRFDELKSLCDVVYLPRTKHISSTMLRTLAATVNEDLLGQLKNVESVIKTIVNDFDVLEPEKQPVQIKRSHHDD